MLTVVQGYCKNRIIICIIIYTYFFDKKNLVSKEAKIRNRYNQAQHLTQDTTWESDKDTKNHVTLKWAKRPALSQREKQGCNE